jgi:hypothetical protein
MNSGSMTQFEQLQNFEKSVEAGNGHNGGTIADANLHRVRAQWNGP